MRDLNRALRPQTWEEVVGQADVKEICRKNLAEDKFPKFSIFYGPTGVGKSCLAELIAREITGYTGNLDETTCIQKYNMAALLGKSDIVSIIDNIFHFKSVTDKVVYILEEVQVLKPKEEQSPFLEELTKIPDNVTIIMCTTQVSALKIELRNRAILFQLSLPSFDECGDFIDSITRRLNLGYMSPKAKEVLIKSSDYTPRSIVKHIELLTSGDSIVEGDVYKFFKSISNSTYLTILQALVDRNCSLYQFTRVLQEALSNSYAQSLLYGFRDFLIELLLEQATENQDIPMTKEERELANQILADFSESTFIEVFEALSKVSGFKGDTTKEILAAFIRMKIVMTQKTVSETLRHNAQEASASTIFSRQNARQLPQPTKVAAANINSVTETSSLGVFGINDSMVYEEDD